MARNIDERIVDMRFNNKQFEYGVRDSIKSLGELKKSLDLNTAAKNFDRLDRAASKISLSGISKGVEALSSRFTALGAVGFTVISRLTNAAINLGTRITKAVTVDPITSGLEEYETKMNSIQTIQTATAGSGTTLDDINEALKDLNDYADKTIYNFAQMTDNLGKFTNAGVGLEDAVAAIQGLSNIAAGAGTDRNRMAAATFQMSQALSNGVIMLEDWNSLAQANMGGPLVQNTLKQVAKEMGVFVDDSKQFRLTLRDNWLTSDIFIEAMKRLSKDKSLLAAAQNVTTFTKLLGVMAESMQSGWANTWEAILGGKDQSTKLWTTISNAFQAVVGASAEARTAMFQFWNDQGGRKDVLIGIAHLLIGIGRILQPIEEAFASVFKPLTGEALVNASKRFRELAEGFKIGEDTANLLKRTFQGLFSVISIGLKVLKLFRNAALSLLGVFLPMGGGLLSITANIGDFFTALNNGVFSAENFSKALEALKGIMLPIANSIKEGIKIAIGSFIYLAKSINSDIIVNELLYLKNQTIKIWDLIVNKLKGISSKINLDGIITSIKSVNKVLEPVKSGASNAAEAISNIGVSAEAVTEKVKQGLTPIIKIGKAVGKAFAYVGNAIKKGYNKVITFITAFVNGIRNTSSDVGEGIGGFFTAIGDGFKNFDYTIIEKLLKGSLLASIILVIRNFMNGIAALAKGAGGFMESIVDVLGSVKDTLETYQNTLKANILLKIAGALAILVVSILLLSSIDPEALKSAVYAMTALMIGLMSSMYGFTKIADLDSFEKVGQISALLLALSASVLILAFAVKKLGSMPIEDVATGVGAIGLLLAALWAFAEYTSKNITRISKAAGGLIVLGIAIGVLAVSVKALGGLPWRELVKGLGGLAGIMALVTGFMALGDKLNGISAKTAASLVIFTIAISRLAGVVESLSKLDPKKLANGLLGLTAILTGITAFMFAASKMEGNFAGVALTVLSISSSMLIISYALKSIAEMTWQELGRGLAGMGAAIVLLVGAMKLMKVTDTGTAASFLIITTSMLFVATVLKDLASLSWTEIGVGLGVMAASLAILVGAMKLIKPTDLASAGALFIMTASLLMVGNVLRDLGSLSWPEIGRGLTAMAGALLILVGAMALLTYSGGFVAALALPVVAASLWLLVPPLLALSAVPMKAVGAGLTLLGGTLLILGAAAYFLAPLIPVVLGIGAAIALIGVGVGLTGAGVLALALGITTLAAALYTGGISVRLFIEELLPLLPLIIDKLGEAFIIGLIKLREALPELGALIKEALFTVANVISDTGGAIAEAIFGLIVKVLNVIDAKAPEIIDAGYSILKSLLLGLTRNISELTEIGIQILVNFIKGFSSKIGDAIDAGYKFIISYVNGLAEAVRANKQELIDAFINLFDAVLGDTLTFVKGKVKDFKNIGGDIVDGLKQGIVAKKDQVFNGMSNIADKVIGTARNVFDTNSPSEVFIKIGEDLLAGLTGGMNNGADDAVGTMNKIGKKVNTAGAKTAEEAAKAAKKAFDADIEWINERKYYNQLTLAEELEAWQTIQEKYKDYADLRKKAAREVYRVENELGAAQFKNSIDWIERKKFFNDLALSEELEAYKRVLKRYDEGDLKHVKAAEEREKAVREVYRVEQAIAKLNTDYANKIRKEQEGANDKRIALEEEYYDKAKEINDKLKTDIKTLVSDYESAVERRAQSLYDAYGIFERVELEDAIKGSTLVDNLENQIEVMTLWRNQLNLLKARGVNTELIEELQEMGPDSVQKIRALNGLSEKELDKFVDLWQEKHQLATERAGYELTDMRDETYSTIQILTKDSKRQLQEYQELWAESFIKLAEESQQSLTQIRDEWLESIGDMRTDADNEMLAMMNSMIDIVGSSDWSLVGARIIENLVYGMRSEEELLLNEAGKLGLKALLRVKDGFADSTVQNIGKAAVFNIIDAMTRYGDTLAKISSSLGNTIKDQMLAPIKSLSGAVSDSIYNFYSEPIIKPVLDLTNVEEGLATVFGQNRSILPTMNTESASKLNFLTGKYDYNAQQQATTTQPPNDITINNTYTVRSDSDIQRISVDLKDTLDRYNYAKGVVVTE